MRILAVDPQPRRHPAVAEVWRPERLGELLGAERLRGDCRAAHAGHRGLFGREQFRQMKPTGYLINIGRGAIVDLAALTAALEPPDRRGRPRRVQTEPLPADHPSGRMENAILTPHIAGDFAADRRAASGSAADNVGRFAGGEPLTNVADKRRWF